jgi:hypothetical protein
MLTLLSVLSVTVYHLAAVSGLRALVIAGFSLCLEWCSPWWLWCGRFGGTCLGQGERHAPCQPDTSVGSLAGMTKRSHGHAEVDQAGGRELGRMLY